MLEIENKVQVDALVYADNDIDQGPGHPLHYKSKVAQNQGGEGEVVGQLSCIYGTITTKIELSDKNKF